MTGPVPSKGCGDNSCIHGRPSGMGTNGGCSCEKEQRPSKERALLSSIQCQRHDCQAVREDLRRVESARVAILAENTYYKQRVADLIDELKQREDQLRNALDVDRAAPEPRVCPTCQGNDRDTPCAYPSEGKPGCLRDKRLAQPPRDGQ